MCQTKARFVQGTVASSAGCLFGTVAVGRLLGLTKLNNLMLSQRCTSGGFAMLVCNIIGAPIPLMFLFNLASGLFGGCFGQVLLDKMGYPVDRSNGQRICRGIAMGAASHATGTASLIAAGEQDTAAIASVSIVVCVHEICHRRTLARLLHDLVDVYRVGCVRDVRLDHQLLQHRAELRAVDCLV